MWRKRPHWAIGGTSLLLAGWCVWQSPCTRAFSVAPLWTTRNLRHGDAIFSLPQPDGASHDHQQQQQQHHRNIQDSPLVIQQNITDILLSYRSNIRRTAQSSQEAQAKKPLWSLVHFLEHNTTDDNEHDNDTTIIDDPPAQVLRETIIPALHAAAALNDYRLLLRLWEATQAFAARHPGVQPALPRLLGETLTQLSRTAASLSKIKRVWQQAAQQQNVQLTPRETNTYLKVLGARQPRAALQVWQTQRRRRQGTNAYSLALVLQALTQSVTQVSQSSTEEDTSEYDDFVPTPLQHWKTACWQWTAAVELLEDDYIILQECDYSPTPPIPLDWTNPVVTALLQLNQKVGTVDPRHPTASLAYDIWQFFTASARNPLHLAQPDAQLVTTVLQSLGDDYETALQIWHKTQQPPNVYSWAAVLACCARAGAYTQAWELFEEVSSSRPLVPNTVVYNTVLHALAHPTTPRRRAGERLSMALRLVERMRSSNSNTATPDTVTFNTLLQVASRLKSKDWPAIQADFAAFFVDYASWPLPERFVHTVLDQMEQAEIPRTALTYRHGIGCARSFQGVLQIVGRALQDGTLIDEKGEIFDAALFVLAQEGDVDGQQLVVAKMIREGVSPTDESLSSIIRGLANSGHTRSIPFLILALTGNKDAAEHLFAVHRLDLPVDKLPALTKEHFTTAITCCLYQNDFDNARRILLHMRDCEMEPTNECLESMARSYARLALDMVHGKRIPEEAIARTQSACDILDELPDAPLRLQALVTRACAAVGLFSDAQEILQDIHESHLKSQNIRGVVGYPHSTGNSEVITGLHRAVLKSAAEQGNVTYALKIADGIQEFGRDCSWGQPAIIESSDAITWSEIDETGQILPPTVLNGDDSYATSQSTMGMQPIDWIYVLEAASKSGHWKVCINTLQFLRPPVSDIHPERLHNKDERDKANAEYKMLSKGLIAAAKCFEIRSQYGWAVRAICDWIEWSGRRPPKRAVLAAVRILSNRGRSDEVQRLISNCLQPVVQDPSREGKGYDLTVYVGAITALYKNGLYDAADDVFIDGVTSGAIPFQLDKKMYGAERRITLDLHGMNTAVAHSAVRCALQQEVLGTSWNRTDLWDDDLVIVTGRGKKSSLHMRPILRPEVQRMLMEEFFPPLDTVSIPGNMGAIRVPSEGIHEWVDHQRQQKDVRMLAVAALLKDITSGNRLKKAFAKVSRANPPETEA